jgi:hypothetical protein
MHGIRSTSPSALTTSSLTISRYLCRFIHRQFEFFQMTIISDVTDAYTFVAQRVVSERSGLRKAVL